MGSALMLASVLAVLIGAFPLSAWNLSDKAGTADKRSVVDAAAARDIVVRASDISQASLHGAWTLASDDTSPNGVKLAAAGDTSAPTSAAEASGYFDVVFTAPAETTYRVWIRLSAADDVPSRGSVWAQFSDAEAGGAPAYRIGTSDALLVSLQPCAGCSVSGWGWQGSSWQFQQSAVITFAAGGVHRMRIIACRDGVQVDQIVLSPAKYMRAAPGGPADDRTTVERNDEAEKRVERGPATEDQ